MGHYGTDGLPPSGRNARLPSPQRGGGGAPSYVPQAVTAYDYRYPESSSNGQSSFVNVSFPSEVARALSILAASERTPWGTSGEVIRALIMRRDCLEDFTRMLGEDSARVAMDHAIWWTRICQQEAEMQDWEQSQDFIRRRVSEHRIKGLTAHARRLAVQTLRRVAELPDEQYREHQKKMLLGEWQDLLTSPSARVRLLVIGWETLMDGDGVGAQVIELEAEVV